MWPLTSRNQWRFPSGLLHKTQCSLYKRKSQTSEREKSCFIWCNFNSHSDESHFGRTLYTSYSNNKFKTSWQRRVHCEVVWLVVHMLSIFLMETKLQSSTSPPAVVFLYSPQEVTLVKKGNSQAQTLDFFFLCCCFCDGSAARDCASNWIPVTGFCFGLWRSSQSSVRGYAADNKLEVEHCPFASPHEQY